MAQAGEILTYDGREWLVLDHLVPEQVYTLRSTSGPQLIIRVTEESLRNDAMINSSPQSKKIWEDVKKQAREISEHYGQQQRQWLNDWAGSMIVDRSGIHGPSINVNYDVGVAISSFADFEKKFTPTTDDRYAEPPCYGWHILYDPVNPLDGLDASPQMEGLVEYAGTCIKRTSMACADLKDCWVHADFVVDEELGNPVAIKVDDRVIYYKAVNGQWYREREDYPDLEEWL